MALDVRLKEVHPGDLIEADFMNLILEELIRLDEELAKLKGTTTPPPAGAPILDDRNPRGDVRVGESLTLIGKNFAPIAQTRVNLGGQEITTFAPGATATDLSFQVPDLFSGLPKTMRVAVEN